MSKRPSENMLAVGVNSNVGIDRTENQDCYGYVLGRQQKLLVVCDGMGGYEGGEIASQIATDTIIDEVLSHPTGDITTVLHNAILAAHDAIMHHAERNPDLKGMGTTCVLFFIDGDEAHVANVGDSRAFLLRGGSVRVVSKDHSKVQELLDANLITEQEALEHSERGVLTQAMGRPDKGRPTPYQDHFRLQPEDRLILASDGVYECMSDQVINELTLEAATPLDAANRLIDYALTYDGSDNSTVLVATWAADPLDIAAAFHQPEPVIVTEASPPRVEYKTSPMVIGAAIAAALVALIAGLAIGAIAFPNEVKKAPEPRPEKAIEKSKPEKDKNSKDNTQPCDCNEVNADKILAFNLKDKGDCISLDIKNDGGKSIVKKLDKDRKNYRHVVDKNSHEVGITIGNCPNERTGGNNGRAGGNNGRTGGNNGRTGGNNGRTGEDNKANLTTPKNTLPNDGSDDSANSSSIEHKENSGIH